MAAPVREESEVGWLMRALRLEPQIEGHSRRAVQVSGRLEEVTRELERTTKRLRELIAEKEAERG